MFLEAICYSKKHVIGTFLQYFTLQETCSVRFTWIMCHSLLYIYTKSNNAASRLIYLHLVTTKAGDLKAIVESAHVVAIKIPLIVSHTM